MGNTSYNVKVECVSLRSICKINIHC